MKGFKTKQQMMEGHYCWGGKAMKKAKGGQARKSENKSENPMRSESTEAARATNDFMDAGRDYYEADRNYSSAQGEGAKRITGANARYAKTRMDDALDRAGTIGTRTAHPYAGVSKTFGDKDLADFREDYDSSLGKKRGGKVMKKAEGGSIRAQFNNAFGEARKRGDKTFEFRGKMYGTELAKPAPKVAVGPHGPGDESFTPDKVGSRMKNVAEENDYRSGSTSQPDFVRKQYSMPGVRMGKAGEPAIVIGSGENESPKPVKSNYNYGVSRTKDEQDLADIVQKKRGGSIVKPKLASDKKKYSDRDMQGIISQAKQLAPKIIQANQARNAQAQAAAGAQQPPMGGAMPARPMMPARPPMGAMPAMKKGGKLKLRRKG